MKTKWIATAALAVLGLWHLGLRARSISLPMISDEGEYAYEARLLAGSGVPYRDAYDQKPPGVFFLYRLAFAAFGESDRSPRLLALLFSWATMALLYALSPPSWPWTSRLAAPAAFGALSTTPIGDLGFPANTEVFLTAFAALSAWLLAGSWDTRAWRARLWLAGLAGGAALALKQPAAWTALAFGLLAAVRPGDASKRLGAAACYFGGCAIVPALFFLYFLARGGAGELVEQALRRNMDYSSLVVASSSAISQLSWAAARLGPAFLAAGWPVFLLAGLGLARTKAKPGANLATLATLWLGSGLVGACTGLFFFPHYFLQIAAPLALAAGLGARWLEGRWRALAAGPWLAAFLSLYPAAVQARRYFLQKPEALARELLYPNPLFESRLLGDYIRRNSGPQDSIYVFGSEPQIYWYAGRRAATRHIFIYPLTLFPRDKAEIERELAGLKEAAPKHIVYVNIPASLLVGSRLGRHFQNGVLELIGRRYRWTGTIDLAPAQSQAMFWTGEEKAPGAMPDWTAEPRLYLFERRQ